MDTKLCSDYIIKLQKITVSYNWENVIELAQDLRNLWQNRRRVFLCGNGGSAGNAMHLANDFLYGIAKSNGQGLKAIALPSNASVITCLANDISYDDIYSQQLIVQAEEKDILIIFSGSGNSPNVIKALEQAKKIGMKSYAILGFSGGKCLELADVPIHFPIDDMQISEDLQMITGHMIMQYLYQNPLK